MALRRLVLLFDGTWNKPESNTNVERLRRLIAACDHAGNPQLVNYIPGVGVKPGITHLLGGAFGFGLSDNVLDGYRWLMTQWRPGDLVYLFGFSRGAYTARSLGGLIRKCGLLKTGADGQPERRAVSRAYAFYRDTKTRPDDPPAVAYRAENAREIAIECIGVWDTVGALGVPLSGSWLPFARSRYQFHDTELSRIVKRAYQALALDERRADYAPAVWTRQRDRLKPGERASDKKAGQIEVEQRWFIGAHADVGGGYESDGAGTTPDPLPDLALAWLQHKAIAAGIACTEPFRAGPTDWQGVPRDSWAEFMHGAYKLLKKPFTRAIGEGVNEMIDASVWERWQRDPDYRPPAVAQALASGRAVVGDVRVQPSPERA